jgi:hypothetical protein
MAVNAEGPVALAPPGQGTLAQAVHQPVAAMCLRPNMAHPAHASPGLP